jgi:hypothetical protein
MKEEKKKKTDERDTTKAEKSRLTAKKNFSLHHNEYHNEIKLGDDLSDVPELYLENLRTEGVL